MSLQASTKGFDDARMPGSLPAAADGVLDGCQGGGQVVGGRVLGVVKGAGVHRLRVNMVKVVNVD
jgi:hypothetical protein